MNQTDLTSVVSTLLIHGFEIELSTRPTSAAIFFTVKTQEKLGAAIRYTFLFSSETVTEALIDNLITTANANNSTPLLISDHSSTDKCICYTRAIFFERLGSWLNTGLILVDDLPSIMHQLGMNQIPSGLVGAADDLLELYTKECIQYLLSAPAKRYGKERSFEALPDGLVLGGDLGNLLFDSKAYSRGFDFTADDIRRFSDYVNDFNTRYSSYVGKIHAFVVVTGKFNDSPESLSNRRDELYASCQTQLCCIESAVLAKIVELLKMNNSYLKAIQWKKIFSHAIIAQATVQKDIDRIIKDGIVH